MYLFLKTFCQPYFWLMAVIGLSLWWGHRRRQFRGRLPALIGLAWFGILVLSIPLVTHLLMGTLEWRYLPGAVESRDVDVIVVLGGGIVPPDQTRSYPEVSGSSFTRCLHAAALHRQFGGPVLICGGKANPVYRDHSEAEVMRGRLIQLGVPAQQIHLEQGSTTTHENARHASEWLREQDYERVLLVTHARHMLRAELCFRKQGVDVVTGPCGFKAAALNDPWYELVVPAPGALSTSHQAISEWIGLAWYRLRGRV